MQGAFVVAEMALALVLLIGAGIDHPKSGEAVERLIRVQSHNALTFGLSLPPSPDACKTGCDPRRLS